MTKNKWLLVSVLSAVSGVGIAAAQPGGRAGHFEKLDANADGVVTTAEFEAGALERWTRADQNQDGKVTAEEMKAKFAAHKAERFAKRDANGNGVLERAEVERMPEAIFAELDADRSGTLSATEMESDPFKRGHKGDRGEFGKGLPGDVDQDGAVIKAEAIAGVPKMVKHIDADGDGKLTEDELGRGHGGRHHRRGAQDEAK